MASRHIKRTEDELTWSETRERFTLEGRQLLRRLMNEVLNEVDAEFQQALVEGTVLEFRPDTAELKRRLLKVAKRELS